MNKLDLGIYLKSNVLQELGKIKDAIEDIQLSSKKVSKPLEDALGSVKKIYDNLETSTKKLDQANQRMLNNLQKSKERLKIDLGFAGDDVSRQAAAFKTYTKSMVSYGLTAEAAKASTQEMLKTNKMFGGSVDNLQQAYRRAGTQMTWFGRIGKSTNDALILSTKRYLATYVGIYGVIKAYRSLVTEGIQLNRIMEDNQYGIAALISANVTLRTSQDRIIDQNEKFNMSMEMSKVTLEKLRLASVETIATFGQLTEVFNQAVGGALSAGSSMGLDPQQVMDNTVEITKLMTNFAGSIGMPIEYINEEIRNLIEGNATRQTRMAIMLFGSPAAANRAVKEARQQVGGLSNLLLGVLDPFKKLSESTTMTRVLAQTTEAYQNIQRKTTAVLFEAFKGDLMRLRDYLNDNADIISQKVGGALERVYNIVQGIFNAFSQGNIRVLEIAKSVVGFATSSTSIEGSYKRTYLLLGSMYIAFKNLVAITKVWGILLLAIEKASVFLNFAKFGTLLKGATSALSKFLGIGTTAAVGYGLYTIFDDITASIDEFENRTKSLPVTKSDEIVSGIELQYRNALAELEVLAPKIEDYRARLSKVTDITGIGKQNLKDMEDRMQALYDIINQGLTRKPVGESLATDIMGNLLNRAETLISSPAYLKELPFDYAEITKELLQQVSLYESKDNLQSNERAALAEAYKFLTRIGIVEKDKARLRANTLRDLQLESQLMTTSDEATKGRLTLQKQIAKVTDDIRQSQNIIAMLASEVTSPANQQEIAFQKARQDAMNDYIKALRSAHTIERDKRLEMDKQTRLQEAMTSRATGAGLESDIARLRADSLRGSSEVVTLDAIMADYQAVQIASKVAFDQQVQANKDRIVALGEDNADAMTEELLNYQKLHEVYKLTQELNAQAHNKALQEYNTKQREMYGSWQEGVASMSAELRTRLLSNYQMAAQMTDNVASSMADSFNTLFVDAMEGRLKKFSDYFNDFTKSILNAMNRMLANQFAAQIMQGVASRFGGTTATTTNPSSTGVSTTGNYSLNTGSTFRFDTNAAGGPVNPGPSLVGEYGPELVYFGRSGYVVPNDVAKMGGGSAPNVKVVINNNTGQETQTNVTQPQFDGESWVIGVTMDAIQRNRMGMRDMIMGGR